MNSSGWSGCVVAGLVVGSTTMHWRLQAARPKTMIIRNAQRDIRTFPPAFEITQLDIGRRQLSVMSQHLNVKVPTTIILTSRRASLTTASPQHSPARPPSASTPPPSRGPSPLHDRPHTTLRGCSFHLRPLGLLPSD